MIYTCCDENRKAAILSSDSIALNGIDYLEVVDATATAPPSLLIHCLKAVPTTLTPANIMILGGESVTGITAVSVAVGTDPAVLTVQTNQSGDFSTYTLRLVNSVTQAAGDPFEVTDVLQGFDPQLAEATFSFKVDCGLDFDCNAQTDCSAAAAATPPPINYLAKDYGSFRTLLLDRLSQLLPAWNNSTEADLGVMLAELIAYRGDLLSYRQDAIATEAYLATARSRISLRRHALLVDYHVHDGANARAWVHLDVGGGTGTGVFLDHTLTRFYTTAPGMPANLAVGAGNEEAALAAGVQVFEPMQDAVLYPEHNLMTFYTWGDTRCCLPQGAVEATLSGSYPNLQPGDVLVFEEMLGPQTGNAADADLRHRCAVRLTQVATLDAYGDPLVDPLFAAGAGMPLTNPATQAPTLVTEIQWAQDDALPFPLCISAIIVNADGSESIAPEVSVAYGNVVLADHGLSLTGISVGTVPQPTLFYPASATGGPCTTNTPAPLPVRFRPMLPDSPLTQAVPLPLAGSPVTPGVVMLPGTGSVSLTDSNGFVCLLVRPGNPVEWPQFFGVYIAQNAAVSANIDLLVVYAPPSGAAGSAGLVVLEALTNLSFKASDPNFIANQINLLSQLLRVPAGYVPPAKPPAGLPAMPILLSDTGVLTLSDTSNPAVPYLQVQPTNPAGWVQLLGVVAQGNQSDPTVFNLSVVYDPPGGSVGVPVPVTMERFFNLSLATVSGTFQSASELISVQSFAQAPNPSLAASDLMDYDPSDAVPAIALTGTFDGQSTPWTAQQDLLGSDETDQVFVVEIESDGAAMLRFATPGEPGAETEGTNGMVPDSGTVFTANYRIGNGTPGNVGAETLINLAAGDSRILRCTNPLPAQGGTDPESADQIRRRAPQGFLTPERSITLADYQTVAAANPQVDHAVASLRWTGSWYSVFLAVEPQGGGNLTPALKKTLKTSVDRFRLAGQDLELESPQYVSLQITLQITVDPDAFRSDVQQRLQQVLGDGVLPDGRKGLFHADNFTFGQTVYLSRVYAAARGVPGVVQVTATQFQTQGIATTRYLAAGEIKLGTLQVARLENDPNFPDHGQLTLVLQGGK
jgi:hypothetical protein